MTVGKGIGKEHSERSKITKVVRNSGDERGKSTKGVRDSGDGSGKERGRKEQEKSERSKSTKSVRDGWDGSGSEGSERSMSEGSSGGSSRKCGDKGRAKRKGAASVGGKRVGMEVGGSTKKERRERDTGVCVWVCG